MNDESKYHETGFCENLLRGIIARSIGAKKVLEGVDCKASKERLPPGSNDVTQQNSKTSPQAWTPLQLTWHIVWTCHGIASDLEQDYETRWCLHSNNGCTRNSVFLESRSIIITSSSLLDESVLHSGHCWYSLLEADGTRAWSLKRTASESTRAHYRIM